MKNATPNARRTTREIQGNSGMAPGRAAALMHSLAWVNGRQYRIAWKIGSSEETEKNVPQRNVMGRMIRLLNVPMLWWDLARSAADIPRRENTMQLHTTHSTNRGDNTSSSG